MSLDEKFTSSADQVRKFTKRPPDAEMLEVYSLYKQATVGDINIPKSNEATAKQKWEAWNSKKGMPKNQAKEQYIAKCKVLAPKYA